MQASGHALTGDGALSASGQFEGHVSVVLVPRTHLEEQPAEGLVAEQAAAPTVLEEDGPALLVAEPAPHPVQHPHEGAVVHHSLLLQVQELEHTRGLQSLILPDLGALPHLLEDGDLNLQDPLEGDGVVEEAEGVDKQVDEELLAFQGDCGVDVLAELAELLVGQASAVRRPVLQSLLDVELGLLPLLAHAADVRVPLRRHALKEQLQTGPAVLLELAEGVVDGGQSFLGEVVADAADEQHVVDPQLVGELVPDDAEFLGGEEDAAGVEEEVEGMVGEAAVFAGVVLGDVSIEVQQVFVGPSEELELDLIGDLRHCVHPVHYLSIQVIQMPAVMTDQKTVNQMRESNFFLLGSVCFMQNVEIFFISLPGEELVAKQLLF